MTNESTGTEMTSLRWTSRDLEAFPDDGKRYEIVDGELYVAKQPDWQHQHLCTRLAGLLDGRVSQLAAPRAPWTVDDLPDALLVSQSVARLEKYREDRARHPQMLARGGELPTAPIFTHDR